MANKWARCGKFPAVAFISICAFCFQSCSALGSPVATVLGDDIPRDQAARLHEIIEDRLLDEAAEIRMVSVSNDEIDLFLKAQKRILKKTGADIMKQLTNASNWEVLMDEIRDMDSDVTSTVDADQNERMHAEKVIQNWRVYRHLYQEYGGRVAIINGLPEPVDAVREYLLDREHIGDFTIYNAADRKAFWEFYTQEKDVTFVNENEIDDIYGRTPWSSANAATTETYENDAAKDNENVSTENIPSDDDLIAQEEMDDEEDEEDEKDDVEDGDTDDGTEDEDQIIGDF